MRVAFAFAFAGGGGSGAIGGWFELGAVLLSEVMVLEVGNETALLPPPTLTGDMGGPGECEEYPDPAERGGVAFVAISSSPFDFLEAGYRQ